MGWHDHNHGPVYLRRDLERLEHAPVDLRDLVALRLGLKCGLRPHEIRYQHAGKINFRDRVLYTHPCKGHPSRPVPVDTTTLKLVREYAEGPGPLIRCKEGYESRSGLYLSKVSLFHIVKGAAKSCRVLGWRGVYPYLLRHFFAAKWVMEGGNIETLRRILGHDSLQHTQRYLAHLIWWEDVEEEYVRIVEVGKVYDQDAEKMHFKVLKDGGTSFHPSQASKIQVEILTSDRSHALEILKDLNEVLLPTLGKHPEAKLSLRLGPEGEEEPETEY